MSIAEIQNPLIKNLALMAEALKNYTAALEEELLKNARQQDININEFSEKAGFISAITLYLENMHAFLSPENIKLSIVNTIKKADEKALTLNSDPFTALKSPELFNASKNIILQWNNESVETNLETIKEHAQGLLAGCDNNPTINNEILTIGARETFQTFIKNSLNYSA